MTDRELWEAAWAELTKTTDSYPQWKAKKFPPTHWSKAKTIGDQIGQNPIPTELPLLLPSSLDENPISDDGRWTSPATPEEITLRCRNGRLWSSNPALHGTAGRNDAKHLDSALSVQAGSATDWPVLFLRLQGFGGPPDYREYPFYSLTFDPNRRDAFFSGPNAALSRTRFPCDWKPDDTLRADVTGTVSPTLVASRNGIEIGRVTDTSPEAITTLGYLALDTYAPSESTGLYNIRGGSL